MKNKIVILLATVFYCGKSPVAPGTIGTLGGCVLYLILLKSKIVGNIYLESIVILILGIVGVFIASKAEEILKKKDASPIVIDEAWSYLITMYMLPITWKTITFGFVLNRFLDIIKPFPCNRLQKLHGGWGIMMDDLFSSLYSNLIIRAMIFLGEHVK